jgi:hypothetical protein
VRLVAGLLVLLGVANLFGAFVWPLHAKAATGELYADARDAWAGMIERGELCTPADVTGTPKERAHQLVTRQLGGALGVGERYHGRVGEGLALQGLLLLALGVGLRWAAPRTGGD